MFLLSGEKLIREYLIHPNLEPQFELMSPALPPLEAPGWTAKQIQLSADLFKEIDVLGTHFNILVLSQPKMGVLSEEGLAAHAPEGLEVVIPSGDPGNLGALIRSCEAFGVPRVFLTKEAAHPFLPKAVKASAGSMLRVPLIRGPALKAFPETCIALDMEGVPIDEFVWPENGMLIVGEEGGGFGHEGQSKKAFQRSIRIPTQGVESLNVVVAASLALALRQRAGPRAGPRAK